MKQLMKKWIPSICVVYTITILCTTAFKRIFGYGSDIDGSFAVWVLLLIGGLHGAGILTGYLPIKGKGRYLVLTSLMQYAVFLGFCNVTTVIFQRIEYFFALTAAYWIIWVLHYQYQVRLLRIEADEINRLLERQRADD